MKKLLIVLAAVAVVFLISDMFITTGESGFGLHSVKQSSVRPDEKNSVRESVVTSGKLRCGYVNWRPYYYVDLKDGNNTPQGLNYDIMTELGKVLDLKIEWVEEIGWGNIGEGFKTNRYDAVCTSMWVDSAKLKNLSLSRPIFFSAPTLYVRADDTRFDNNAESINKPGVKIAVIDGSPMFRLVKESFPNAEIVALPQLVQDAEYLLTVTTKKADIAIMDPDEIKRFMEANPGQMKKIDGVPPVRILPHVLAFPPDDPQFTAMMNAALQILIDNGVMDKIRKKYDTNYLVPTVGFRE